MKTFKSVLHYIVCHIQVVFKFTHIVQKQSQTMKYISAIFVYQNEDHFTKKNNWFLSQIQVSYCYIHVGLQIIRLKCVFLLTNTHFSPMVKRVCVMKCHVHKFALSLLTYLVKEPFRTLSVLSNASPPQDRSLLMVAIRYSLYD